MPFFWVSSIFMGFFFLLVLIFLYFSVMDFFCLKSNYMKNFNDFFLKW